MTTSDGDATGLSIVEAIAPLFFNEWLKRRRQELDLTQEQLARRASCSVFAIRKIELGERRPSKRCSRVENSGVAVFPRVPAFRTGRARGGPTAITGRLPQCSSGWRPGGPVKPTA